MTPTFRMVADGAGGCLKDFILKRLRSVTRPLISDRGRLR